ncbi:MAG: DUF6538 domain-containing protein [Luminiphilus sp.]
MNLTCLKSGIWQVELRIPSDVRVVLGKTRFAKSTGTRDKRKVASRALPVLAEWLRYRGFVSQNLQNPFKDLHFCKQLERRPTKLCQVDGYGPL